MMDVRSVVLMGWNPLAAILCLLPHSCKADATNSKLAKQLYFLPN
jgi:hypothetical protein